MVATNSKQKLSSLALENVIKSEIDQLMNDNRLWIRDNYFFKPSLRHKKFAWHTHICKSVHDSSSSPTNIFPYLSVRAEAVCTMLYVNQKVNPSKILGKLQLHPVLQLYLYLQQ